MHHPKLCGLVLAGGEGRRFGGNKLLAPCRGSLLVLRPVQALLSIGIPRIVVVTGAYHSEINDNPAMAEILRENPQISLTACENWHEGMGATLVTGLRALGPADTLVVLGDQPMVQATDLQNLIERWQENPEQPAAAVFDNTLGPPAILPKSWHSRLLTLSPATGAKPLLASATCLTRVPMASAAHDVDTRADLDRCHPPG